MWFNTANTREKNLRTLPDAPNLELHKCAGMVLLVGGENTIATVSPCCYNINMLVLLYPKLEEHKACWVRAWIVKRGAQVGLCAISSRLAR